MAAFGPCSDEDRLGSSELYALYVLPRAWRAGIGSSLLTACGDVRSLWVLKDNVETHAFYRRFGFEPDGRTAERELGSVVATIRMVRNLG